MKLSAVVSTIAATETRFLSSSSRFSRASRSTASRFWTSTSSRKSSFPVAIRGLAHGLQRHARLGQDAVAQLEQVLIDLVEVLGQIAAAAEDLPVAGVQHALHPVEPEDHLVALPQVLADGQHSFRLGLSELQSALGEKARQLPGEPRIWRMDGQRPEVDLVERPGLADAGGLAGLRIDLERDAGGLGREVEIPRPAHAHVRVAPRAAVDPERVGLVDRREGGLAVVEELVDG